MKQTMVSFAQLLEQLEKNKEATPLMTSGEDGPALTVVKAGKDMHGEGETSFWEEFISLCSNADGLANLFSVSKEKIKSWPSRIQEHLDKLDQIPPENSSKENQEVMPTGDTGAFVSNQDPDIGAI